MEGFKYIIKTFKKWKEVKFKMKKRKREREQTTGQKSDGFTRRKNGWTDRV